MDIKEFAVSVIDRAEGFCVAGNRDEAIRLLELVRAEIATLIRRLQDEDRERLLAAGRKAQGEHDG